MGILRFTRIGGVAFDSYFVWVFKSFLRILSECMNELLDEFMKVIV